MGICLGSCVARIMGSVLLIILKTVVSEMGHIVHDANGNEVIKPAGEVLIHEIVGHAAPVIAGSETGNAVKNENIVRRELNLPERVDEKDHVE